MLFADDAIIFIHRQNISEIMVTLNNELIKLSNWKRCSKSTINVSKTFYNVSCSTTNTNLDNILIIKMDNNELSKVIHIFFLGETNEKKNYMENPFINFMYKNILNYRSF